MEYIDIETNGWFQLVGPRQYEKFVHYNVSDYDLGYYAQYQAGAPTAHVQQFDDEPGYAFDSIDVNGLSEAEALAKITGYLAGLRAKATEA